jgi:hypothetical protein
MLENPKERVKLLKAGFPIKTIENFYIKYNNLIIVDIPILTGQIDIDLPSDKTAQDIKPAPVDAYQNEEELTQAA